MNFPQQLFRALIVPALMLTFAPMEGTAGPAAASEIDDVPMQADVQRPDKQRAAGGLINVDFQGSGPAYSGVGVLGGSADMLWNAVGPAGAGHLLYANGSGTSNVAITTTYTATFSNTLQSHPLLTDWVLGEQHLEDTLTISGLTPSAVYDLAFYDGFYWQNLTIPTQPGLVAQLRPDYTLGSDGAPPFPAGSFVVLRGVIASATGQITILDTAVTTGGYPDHPWSTLAGFQILPQARIKTADQCKKDGWKTLTRTDGTGFKNQGECVRNFEHQREHDGAPADDDQHDLD